VSNDQLPSLDSNMREASCDGLNYVLGALAGFMPLREMWILVIARFESLIVGKQD